MMIGRTVLQAACFSMCSIFYGAHKSCAIVFNFSSLAARYADSSFVHRRYLKSNPVIHPKALHCACLLPLCRCHWLCAAAAAIALVLNGAVQFGSKVGVCP